MEIIVLPYMAVSFAIWWAVFAPFTKLDDFQEWTFAKMEMSDLLAIFVPLSFLMAAARWTIPADDLKGLVLALIAAAILMFVICGLVISLFLLSKMDSASALKRMSITGLVVPLGALLTLLWIVFPLWAYAYSVFYAIPATLALIPVTLALRGISCWAVRPSHAIDSKPNID